MIQDSSVQDLRLHGHAAA
jgi:thymidylate kinase